MKNQKQEQLANQSKRKQMIEDRTKRINLKSKRTRTMYRKAIEVSQMCNLDIFILTLDRDTAKLVQYNSIRPDGTHFTSEIAW